MHQHNHQRSFFFNYSWRFQKPPTPVAVALTSCRLATAQEVTDWRTAYTGVDAQTFAEIQKGSTKYRGSELDMQRSVEGLMRMGVR